MDVKNKLLACSRKMNKLEELLDIEDLPEDVKEVIKEEISKRSEEEKRLKESEEQHKAFFENAAMGVAYLTKMGYIIDVNPGVEQICGVERQEMIGKHFTKLNILNVKDIPKYLNMFKEIVFKGGSTHNEEVDIIRKDGKIVPIEANTGFVRKDGKISGLVVILNDITERKKAKEELENIFKLSPDMITVCSPEGEFLKVSPSCERILGYTVDETIELGWAKLIHPDDVERTNKEVGNQLKGSSVANFVNRFRCKNGTYKTLEWQATSAEEGIVYATARDITERKRAEEDLKESEKRGRIFFENALEYYYMVSSDGKILDINRSALDTLGYTKEEIVGKPLVATIYAPSSQEKAKKLLGQWKETGQIRDEELTIVTKQGLERTILLNVESVKDEHGKVQFSISTQKDVTELKRTEEENVKLSSAINQIQESIIITNENGNIEYINPKVTELTGYTKEEIIGQNPRILNSGAHPKEFYKEMWETISSGKGWKGEFHNKKKNGELYWESASISPIKDRNGKIKNFIAVKEDITEQKKAEKHEKELILKLARAERIEALGILAGGIAHDLNNIFMPILILPDILLNSPEAKNYSEETKTMLKTIKEATKRGNYTIKNMLSIIRDIKEEDMMLLDLNNMIIQYFSSSKFESIKKDYGNVDINTDLEEGKLSMMSLESLIENSVMNLVRNASEAGASKVNIKTYKKSFSSEQNLYDNIPSGDYVVIEVSDNGLGITREYINRMFEAFNTTKSISEESGSGLGLATTYRIVKGHKGYVDVQSEVGKGTTFRLYFPSIDAVVGDNNEDEEIVGGTEHILIVDDDYNSRYTISLSLKIRGYQITEAKSGEEAIRLFEKAKENGEDSPFDLVGIDMQMEGLDGFDTYIRLKEIYSDQKMAIISGCMDDNKKVKAAQDLGAGYIPKPFDPDTLARRIRESLDVLKTSTL